MSKVRICEFESRNDSIAEQLGCKPEEAFERILDQLKKQKYLKYYAAIMHDQDINDNGETVQPHVHIVIQLAYPCSYEGVASGLKMPAQTICKIHGTKLRGGKKSPDIGQALLYLTHKNAPEKHQYPDDLVVASPDWDWKAIRAKSENLASKENIGTIIEGIENGTITRSNMFQYISIEAYSKHKSKIQNALEYKELEQAGEHHRNMQCIYIYGSKGSGKTSLAKQFCENQGLSYFVSGGSNDPFEGYSGQEVVILDDARADAFAPEEWLKILDNNTNSSIKSRYHNKSINCKYIILTSTVSLMHFFDIYPQEDPHQLFRRIKTYVYVKKECIDYYTYRQDYGTYACCRSTENIILSQFPSSDLTQTEINTIVNGFSPNTEGQFFNCIERGDNHE